MRVGTSGRLSEGGFKSPTAAAAASPWWRVSGLCGAGIPRFGRNRGDERKRTADDVSKGPGVIETGDAPNLQEQSARCLASVRATGGVFSCEAQVYSGSSNSVGRSQKLDSLLFGRDQFFQPARLSIGEPARPSERSPHDPKDRTILALC